MSEVYGMMVGAADALRNTNLAWSVSLQEAQNHIDRLSSDVRIHRANESKLKLALALEQARSAGLAAKMRAIQDGLKSAGADHPVLRKTGRHYPDGTAQIHADEVYAAAFDEKARELGLKGNLRVVAA